MADLHDLLAYEVVGGIKGQQFTAEQYVGSIIKRIEEVD